MTKIPEIIEKIIKYGIAIAVLVLLFKVYSTGKKYLNFRQKTETGQTKAEILKEFSEKRKELDKMTPKQWQKYLNDTIRRNR